MYENIINLNKYSLLKCQTEIKKYTNYNSKTKTSNMLIIEHLGPEKESTQRKNI